MLIGGWRCLFLVIDLAVYLQRRVWDFVETIVNCLSLGQVSEETPCSNLAAAGSGIIQALILSDGAIVPFQCAIVALSERVSR